MVSLFQLKQYLNSFHCMFSSKHKQKIRHYKSLDNLHFVDRDYSADKKNTKPNHFDAFKNNRNHKKQSQTRINTETYERLLCTKQEAKKYNQFFKNQIKVKREERKHKQSQTMKTQNFQATSYKKIDKSKILSPNVSKFHPRKEIAQIESIMKNTKNTKKPLKKANKNMNFKRSPQKHEFIESIFIDKNEKDKKIHSKSKKDTSISKSKQKKKIKKFKTQISLDTTPSCLLGQQIEIQDLVGQGTFGKVFRGKLRKSGEIIAIKRVLQDSRYKNRQIEIIKLLKNDFIIQVLGSYIAYQSGQQFLNIMMKHYEQNLYHRIKFNRQLKINNLEMKIIIYQIFKGLSYLHSLRICHRDIKPENILLKGCQAVICDFGSAKVLNEHENNIAYICARCYRAPQLIFGSTKYSTIVDIWSAGCVILEMLNGDPLFIGQTSISHLLEIIKIMGTPTLQEVLNMNPDYNMKDYKFPKIKKQEWQKIFPEVDTLLVKLIDIIMIFAPSQRATAAQVLSHEYFDELRDQLTYQHIKSQYHLQNLFNFSEQQLATCRHLQKILIPQWYKGS